MFAKNLYMAFSKSENFNANVAKLRIARINPRKFAKFAYLRYSRSKAPKLSSDFEKTMRTYAAGRFSGENDLVL